MKAAFIRQPGPAESIVYGDLPLPLRSPQQLLIQVTAAAVNPIDTYIRGGAVAMELPQPFVVGCDFAGVVVEAPNDSAFHAGQRVWGSNQGILGRQGTCCETIAVDPCWVYPTPDEVADDAAAAAALVGITAHLGLFRDARLQAGEIVLVQGGTGGVGNSVLQMAKAVGAKVMATAGTDEKVAACLEAGADWAINYHAEDFLDQLRAQVPDGVDVWWETSRNPNLDGAVAALKRRGRIILMAGRDAKPPFPVGPFYVKECRLLGFVMFLATAAEQQRAAEDMNRWLVDGRLSTTIGRTFTLDQTAVAHRLQEDSTIHGTATLQGKIVIRP